MSLSDSVAPICDISSIAGYTAGTGASATGGSNILTDDITIPKLCTRLTVTIATGTASVFSALCTSGSNQLLKLNGGTALVAAGLYAFTFGCRPGETWNFQLATSGTITAFYVEGNHGGI